MLNYTFQAIHHNHFYSVSNRPENRQGCTLLRSNVRKGPCGNICYFPVHKDEAKPVTRYHIITFICLGLGGAALIWYKTQDIGWLTYIISPAGGGLIVLLSLLIWKKNNEGESEGEDIQDN